MTKLLIVIIRRFCTHALRATSFRWMVNNTTHHVHQIMVLVAFVETYIPLSQLKYFVFGFLKKMNGSTFSTPNQVK